MNRWGWLSALALIGLVGCAGSADVRYGTPKIKFSQMQKMVGKWAMLGEDGKPMPGSALESRFSAGGSAIVETIFPGEPHEMVSVYHTDGSQILMTHYCALGNAPVMRLEPESDENTWVFHCHGEGTNFHKNDTHMAHGKITWIDENRFRSEWTTSVDGVLGESIQFEMVRIE